MNLTTLENRPLAEITAAFNEGFSDYVVRVDATGEYLANRLRSARVDYDHSVGGWLDGKLVALLITGIDDWQGTLTAFNAGTCVAPSARGQHFTTQAYDFLIPRLQRLGVAQLMLEVIQENDRAIHVYERVGFQKTRALRCFAGELSLPGDHSRDGFQIIIDPLLELDVAASFHDFTPSWECSFAAFKLNREQYRVYQLHRDGETHRNGQLIAYAIVNAGTGHLISFAVHPGFRRQGLATTLFAELARQHSTLKVNNIEASDQGTLSFLDRCGFHNVINQYEMAMAL